MPRKRLHMTFPEHLITEPLIYDLGKKFQVVTNIRRANIEERVGWVILELEGDEGEIQRAVDHARNLGVDISEIEGDVLEG